MQYNKSNDKRHGLNRDVVDSGFLEGVVVAVVAIQRLTKTDNLSIFCVI